MASNATPSLPIAEPSAQDAQSIRAWWADYEEIVKRADYEEAERFLAPGYPTPFWFGNAEPDLMHSFPEMREKQWKLVWPFIKDIEPVSLSDGLPDVFVIRTSADRCWAVLAIEKRAKIKTGAIMLVRMTYILVRAAVDAPWNAVHAHHSSDPRAAAKA